MRKLEYLGFSMTLSAFVYCLIVFPLYRWFIIVLLTLIVLMVMVRLMSRQLNALVEDSAYRTQLKQERHEVDIELSVKEKLRDEYLRGIKQVGQWSMHPPKRADLLALPEPVNDNLPTFVGMSDQQLHSTLKMVYMGIKDDGQPLYLDFTKLVHTVIAGATGGGKSNLIHVILCQLLKAKEQVAFDLIDQSSNTFADYPLERASKDEEIRALLTRWVNEFERRKALLENTLNSYGLATKDIEEYNEVADESLPYSYMIIEEGADLFDSRPVVEALGRILRGARKLGLQVILITQAATADDIPTKFRGQFLTRIQFPNKEQSLNRMLNKNAPMESLNNKGRAFIDAYDHGQYLVQTPLIDPEIMLSVSRHRGFEPNAQIIDHGEVIDLSMSIASEESLPDVSEGTTKNRMQELAQKLKDQGLDPKDVPPVNVIKHLNLSGNGRDYRYWEQVRENGVI